LIFSRRPCSALPLSRTTCALPPQPHATDASVIPPIRSTWVMVTLSRHMKAVRRTDGQILGGTAERIANLLRLIQLTGAIRGHARLEHNDTRWNRSQTYARIQDQRLEPNKLFTSEQVRCRHVGLYDTGHFCATVVEFPTRVSPALFIWVCNVLYSSKWVLAAWSSVVLRIDRRMSLDLLCTCELPDEHISLLQGSAADTKTAKTDRYHSVGIVGRLKFFRALKRANKTDDTNTYIIWLPSYGTCC
jgi:hypothetical protein